MKKVILGSAMFLAGVIGAALLMASSMSVPSLEGQTTSFWWSLSEHGLIPILCVFVTIAAIGLVVAIAGMYIKED